MKMIMIAAATLMTGASVYGVIDYNKRSGNRDFENLYRKDNAADPVKVSPTPAALEKDMKVAVADDKATVIIKEEKPVKKLPKKKRKVSFKTFSRAEPSERLAD